MNFRRTAAWITTLAVAAGSLTCSSDISDPDPEPASLTKSGGDEQVGLINEPLADSLVVTVEDERGQPLPGIIVSWSVGGGGSVDQAQVTTGDDGKAAVERTLGDNAGVVTTTAAVTDLPAVVFTSTAADGGLPTVYDRHPAVRLSGQRRGPRAPARDPAGGRERAASGAGVAVTASVSWRHAHRHDRGRERRDRPRPLYRPRPHRTVTATTPSSSTRRAISPRSPRPSPSRKRRARAIGWSSRCSRRAKRRMAKCSTRQPAVRAEDADGNPLAAGIAVTASATGASLSGTASVETDANGVAAFTDLALSGPSGSYTLRSPRRISPAPSPMRSRSRPPRRVGQWTAPITWPIVAIHTMLLPMGGCSRSTGPMRRRSGTRDRHLQAGARAGQPLLLRPCAACPTGGSFSPGGHIDDNQGLPNLTTLLRHDGLVDVAA